MIEFVIIKRTGMDRKTKARIQTNREAGKCIVCGENPVHKREACTTCHGRYISNQPKTKAKRQVYEAMAIAGGMIGENRQGQRIANNPYKQLCAKAEAS